MKLIKYLILSSALCLSSCGFTLQNGPSLPKEVRSINLQTNDPYSGLAIALRQNILDSGVTLTTNAPVTLKIINKSFGHNNPNMVSSTQATIYTFTYQATFALYSNNNQLLLKPQTVTVNRTITLNPNEILEANNKTATLKQAMRDEIIFKIFNILSAKNSREALSSTFSHTS